jgi:hypothetical protein
MNARSDSFVVHRLTTGWRIAFHLGALLALTVILLPTVLWMRGKTAVSPGSLSIMLLALGASVFICAWAARIRRYRLELHADRIRYVGAWGFRELALDQIKGFRVLPTQYVHTLILQPRTRPPRKLSIGLMFERRRQLMEWLTLHLTDLDHDEQLEELADIATDTSFGATEEVRLGRLSSAKKTARTLNIAGGIFGAWAFVYPQPYDLPVVGLIALPFVAVFSVRKFGGLLRLDGKKNSAYPNVATAMLMPPLILFLRALLDWNVLHWGTAWPALAGILFLAMAVLVACLPEMRRRVGLMVTGLLFSTLYAYGTGLYLNCRHDRSTPLIYESRVVEAHVTHGKHTSYTLTLAPFVDDEPSRQVDVPRATYENHRVGDSVRIFVHEGVLGIPWFWVR